MKHMLQTNTKLHYLFACLQILDTGSMSAHALSVYLDEMEKDGAWGDGIVLSAAALLYGRPIVILSSDGHMQSIDTAVPSAEAEPMRLGLVNGNHYVSIIKNDMCICDGESVQSQQLPQAENLPVPAELSACDVHDCDNGGTGRESPELAENQVSKVQQK